MHPLVQFTTKTWLAVHNELDVWSQRFIYILDITFHDSNDETFEKCEPLIAHAYAAIPYRPSDDAIQPLRAWASLTQKVAHYYDQRTALGTAQNMYRIAAQAFEITLGAAAPEALKCRTQQALMLFHTSRTTEAEIFHRNVLRLQQKSLGGAHFETLETMDYIGNALAFQHRYSEAEALHVQALETRLRDLGPAHASTQESLNKRGIFLLGQSRYSEAYTIWKQAREARGNTCDLNWTSELDLIGLKLQLQGRPADAEPYLRESLTEKERICSSEDNSIVPKGTTNLARNLLSQEKYAEAEPLLRRAHAWYNADERQGIWPEEPNRLQTMSELALTLSQTGNLEEAERLARQCLLERREICGPFHRETLESTWILAGILEKTDNLEEALRLYASAYEGAKETLGDGHEDTKDYSQDYTKLREKVSEALLQSKIEAGKHGDVVQVEQSSAEITAHNEGAATLNSMLGFGSEHALIASTPYPLHTGAREGTRMMAISAS
jgi:hypothetical protein